MSDILWWTEEVELRDLGIDVPAWIAQDIATNQLAAILQGGCASGAYMPAVDYRAHDTMRQYGNDVLEYLDDSCAWPSLDGCGWNSFVESIVSTAVELWAGQIRYAAEEALRVHIESQQGEEE